MEISEQSSMTYSEEKKREIRVALGPVLELTQPFWHAMPSWLAPMFRWNTYLQQGFVQCAGQAKMIYPEGVVIDHSMTLASMTIPGWEKRERVWDSVRQSEFPSRPSRIGAWYLFDDPKYLEQAQEKCGWFIGRDIFEVRVVPGANVFRADMDLVGGSEDQWTDRARKYWSGEPNPDGIVEVVVSGTIYVPGWNTDEYRTGLQQACQKIS